MLANYKVFNGKTISEEKVKILNYFTDMSIIIHD